jgi:hypothetical protein
MILGTFNGANVIALPSDLGLYGMCAPSSVEWEETDIVSASTNPFTGQQDVFDWMAAYWMATLSFATMDNASIDYWTAFLGELRGPVNAFLCGNPKRMVPKGSVALVSVPAGSLTPVTGIANAPVVNGAGQTGYTLNIRGLAASQANVFLPGDLIQVGFRAYKVLEAVTADGSGHATISIWPPLRQTATEVIADGQAIVTAGVKGLYRLTKGNGQKYSISALTGNGLSPLVAREFL